MNTRQLELKKAFELEVEQVASWFTDKEQVNLWAGPEFNYPVTNTQFVRQLLSSPFISFSLMYKQELIGFGQSQILAPYLHLGRLVINPKYRGKGLSSYLIKAIIAQGCKQMHMKQVSLFVYTQNTIALAAYLKLGFVKTILPAGFNQLADCEYLTLQV